MARNEMEQDCGTKSGISKDIDSFGQLSLESANKEWFRELDNAKLRIKWTTMCFLNDIRQLFLIGDILGPFH